MTPMALLLNLLWLVFGGLWMGIAWGIAAVVMAITIIGIPWARAAFNIAVYTMLPFGFKAVSRLRATSVRVSRCDRQYHLAGAGRVVAGARASGVCGSFNRDHRRHTIRLGAPQAGRNRPLANGQGHRLRRCTPAVSLGPPEEDPASVCTGVRSTSTTSGELPLPWAGGLPG